MRKRHTIKYPILSDAEILLKLKEYTETNKISCKTMKLSDPCLFNNIYNKINDNGIPKGCKRLFYYLDILYGDENDYSDLLIKCNSDYYWTDKRICKIIKSYIEANKNLYAFAINNKKVIQAINRKPTKESINYYLKQIGFDPDSDICNSHKNGFWTFNVAVDKAKEIYDKYGYLSRSIWLEHYSETPLNKYSLSLLKNAVNYNKSLQAKDGKMYRSLREVFVANLLWDMGIAYLKDKIIDTSYCRTLRYDFYLIDYDCYVEIWGYNHKNKEYTARKEEKIELYKNNSFKLIEIEFELFHSYNTFLNIARDIIQKLEEHGIVIKNSEFTLERILKETLDDLEKMKVNLLNSLIPYIYDQKYLPSEAELKDAKEYSLIIDIKRLGGFKEAANFLNLLPKHKMKRINKTKKWTEEKIISELVSTLKSFDLNYFPLLEVLKNEYNSALGAVIRSNMNYNLIIKKIQKTEYIPTFDEHVKLEDYNTVVKRLGELNNNFGFIPNKKHIYNIDNSFLFYNKLRKYFNGYVSAAHMFDILTEKEYKSLSI